MAPANTDSALSADDHPLFSGAYPIGLISGDAPRFPTEAPEFVGAEAMAKELRNMGLQAEPTKGCYQTPEKSFIVHKPTREQLFALGHKFGQESVIYTPGGSDQCEYIYSHGDHAGQHHPVVPPHQFFKDHPDDYWTYLPSHGLYFRLDFNFKQLHPTLLQEPFASMALKTRGLHLVKGEYTVPEALDRLSFFLRATLQKSVAGPAGQPFPHAYPWHDTKTSHCLYSPGGLGVLISPLGKDEAPAAGALTGSSDYAHSVVPFGRLDPTQKQSLHHYPLEGKSQAVDQMVRDHGYQSYGYGGSQGRPDFARRNYDTKHLPIADSGVDTYSGDWRKLHELAHALTEPEIDSLYGDGQRIGALGQHRTLREALRAVHWEWLATHRQRALTQALGVAIDDHDFARELNTVMHDAVHRSVGGEHVDPSDHGFVPNDHPTPLETALGVVRENASNLGLQGMHDLRKTEGRLAVADKEYGINEVKEFLAKTVRDRVAQYEQSLLELRKRELEVQAQKLQKSTCAKCGSSGICKCMGKVEARPDGKKPKVIPAPGSGGKVTPGKKLEKVAVPEAKGASTGASTKSVPMSKPAAAPAAVKPIAPPVATLKPAKVPVVGAPLKTPPAAAAMPGTPPPGAPKPTAKAELPPSAPPKLGEGSWASRVPPEHQDGEFGTVGQRKSLRLIQNMGRYPGLPPRARPAVNEDDPKAK